MGNKVYSLQCCDQVGNISGMCLKDESGVVRNDKNRIDLRKKPAKSIKTLLSKQKITVENFMTPTRRQEALFCGIINL